MLFDVGHGGGGRQPGAGGGVLVAESDAVLIARVHEDRAVAAWRGGLLDEVQRAVDAAARLHRGPGTEATGQMPGQLSLLPLLDNVLAAVEVPVAAAGGIGTRRAMAATLAAGAEGTGVGTGFVATHEANFQPPTSRPGCALSLPTPS